MCSNKDLDQLFESVKELKRSLSEITLQMTMVRQDFYGNGKKGIFQKIMAYERFIWMFGGSMATLSALLVIIGTVAGVLSISGN
ncbi:MAG: hypothetical protein HRT90_06175 [Candidatus Margulisbacteria bacterium]|nr:hypothetical protein [Candidatus Margulisiibacteriota bacterium]